MGYKVGSGHRWRGTRLAAEGVVRHGSGEFNFISGWDPFRQLRRGRFTLVYRCWKRVEKCATLCHYSGARCGDQPVDEAAPHV